MFTNRFGITFELLGLSFIFYFEVLKRDLVIVVLALFRM